MGKCQLYRDIERLRIPEPDCGHIGERLIGHNLALEKAETILSKCPKLPPQGYTGWYVLVRRKNDGSWEPIRCIEQFDETWNGEDKFDVILPIPNPEGLPEWDGF